MLSRFTVNSNCAQRKGVMVLIDVKATKSKLHASGRTIPGWARSHNFDTYKVAARFAGRGSFSEDEIAALETDGLLVEEEEAA